MKVIIIEDDPMVAKINRQYLEHIQGLKVIGIFGNGKEGLDFMRFNSVDLIILDVYMPDLNGLEVLREMRRLGLKADVIMVTAANEARQVDETLRLGVVDYLVKPFTEARFKDAVEKYLTKKNALNSTDVLDQALIDKMVGGKSEAPEAALQKGLQQATLDLIMESLSKTPKAYFSCEELALTIGLSKVTVRRYLNHLSELRLIESKINYDTGGRPSVRYRLKAQS